MKWKLIHELNVKEVENKTTFVLKILKGKKKVKNDVAHKEWE